MTKKMIKVWAGIFMLLAGIFVGNMGAVQASITEDVAAIEAIWKRIEKLPTQAEKTISPVVIQPGEQASALKTYTFGGETSVFSVPIHLGSSPEVFLKVAVQGFSGNIFAKVGEGMIQSSNGEFFVTCRQSGGNEQKLLILKNAADSGKSYTISVTLYRYEVMPPGKVSLKAGEWAKGYKEGNGEYLYKIKAPSDGVIEIEPGTDVNRSSGGASVETMLLNSKCKAVGDESYSNEDDRAKYCVRKGTYYIKATDDGLFQFRYRFTKMKTSKNVKQSKAMSVKRGKTVKGILAAGEGEKNGRWYKIVLPKTKNVTVSTKVSVGDINDYSVYIYKKGSSKPVFAVTAPIRFGGPAKYSMSKKCLLDKGTYYMKVFKRNNYKKSSVQYSIKWK